MISPELLAAYRQTRYRVDRSPVGPFVLRIGEASAPADRLCERLGVDCWSYVTACNPRSRPLSPEQNRARMARLRALLDAEGYTYFAGAGEGEDASWTPEPSLFIAGADSAYALELARRFDQNAVVCGRLGRPAELLLNVTASFEESENS